MTRRMIEITCQNTLAKARKLEACAERMRAVARTDIGNIKNEIEAAWQGDEARAYLNKMDLTAAGIETTAKRLINIATTLRNVTEIFRKTELRAIEIAEQRTFGK